GGPPVEARGWPQCPSWCRPHVPPPRVPAVPVAPAAEVERCRQEPAPARGAQGAGPEAIAEAADGGGQRYYPGTPVRSRAPIGPGAPGRPSARRAASTEGGSQRTGPEGLPRRAPPGCGRTGGPPGVAGKELRALAGHRPDALRAQTALHPGSATRTHAEWAPGSRSPALGPRRRRRGSGSTRAAARSLPARPAARSQRGRIARQVGGSGGGRVLVGTASWTDKSLIESGQFYPPEVRNPEDRLRYYASQFPIVEVDSTYYYPPTERNAAL